MKTRTKRVCPETGVQPRARRLNSGSERGFGILLVLLALVVTLLMMGLAIDTGQVFIVQSELQAFADNAAVTAAYELDGTWRGIERATAAADRIRQSAVTRGDFTFAEPARSNLNVLFALAPKGSWRRKPPSAVGYRFVKVNTRAVARLWLLPVLPNIRAHHPVSATAVAGQVRVRAAGEGLAPFSPDAHDPSDPNFGFVPGESYTLRWAPGGGCAGDQGFRPGGAGRKRGYLDVGQRGDEAGMEDAVLNAAYYLERPLSAGSEVHYMQEEVDPGSALDRLFHQDTDTASVSAADYRERGNGRRVLIVPVNDGNDPALVAGFAAFLEQASACGDNGPCCATYIGPAPVLHGKGNGAGPPGLYEVRLLR